MRNSPNASQGRRIEKFKEKQRYSAIKNPQKISTLPNLFTTNILKKLLLN
jgi:hypothetical protein